VIAYIAGMISSQLLVELIITGAYHNQLNSTLRVSQVASLLISFLCFLFSWLKDPGLITKDKTIDFYELLNLFDPESLCPECEVVRPPRSRHCNICNQCVNRFDHHCPWVNNCVGASNHGWFFAYIFSTFIYVTLVTYISGEISWYMIFEDLGGHELHLTFFDSWAGDYKNHVYIVISFILLALGLFFLSSLLMLLNVQTKNFLTNMTTSERFGRIKPVETEMESSSEGGAANESSK
jgi:palmitoyltransferase ZDHHC13/17